MVRMTLFDILSGQGKRVGKKEAERKITGILKKIEESKKDGDDYRTAYLYHQVSQLCHEMGDKRSVDYSLEAARYNLKIKRYFNVGWSYRNAALFSYQFKNYRDAEGYLTKAIEYFLMTKSLDMVQWCYELAGSMSEDLGNFQAAFKYYTHSLDIKHNRETEKKVKDLMKKIPHPVFELMVNKESVEEGEDVNFTLLVKNEFREPLKDLCVIDKHLKKIGDIPRLNPGEEKRLTEKLETKGFEFIESPYDIIVWKTPDGETLQKDIEKMRISISPKITIKPYLSRKPEIRNYSYFAVMVRNESTEPINNVKLHIDFPIELKVKPITPYVFKRILPGDEKGFVFKILPTIVGETRITPEIEYEDVDNRVFKKPMEPFLLEETLEEPRKIPVKAEPEKPSSEEIKRIESIQNQKKYLISLLREKPMTEPEYTDTLEGFHSESLGYTLKGVGLGMVSNHILEECKCISLVGFHKLKDERLFLFSGESIEDKKTYLMTIAVKKRGNLITLAFKLYSDKKEGLKDILSKIAGIIKYTIIVMSFAVEVEKIEVKETINIIDSIVQRSKIGAAESENNKKIELKDSVVQRTDI